MPANPRELFEDHHMEWADDFTLDASRKGVKLTETQIKTLILLDIEHRVQSWDRNLKSFNLPQPTDSEINDAKYSDKQRIPAIIREELDYDVDQLKELYTRRQALFTNSQAEVFDMVMSAVNVEQQILLFIDARGGTGKTFVLNSILAAVRCKDHELSASILKIAAITHLLPRGQ